MGSRALFSGEGGGVTVGRTFVFLKGGMMSVCNSLLASTDNSILVPGLCFDFSACELS